MFKKGRLVRSIVARRYYEVLHRGDVGLSVKDVSPNTNGKRF
ncbi:hypothetical protein [Salmonella phage CKT1]|nr:hypothetical protein [Salmonella phage CKT1]